MATETANLVVYAGAIVGLGTLCVAAYNSRKAVQWKRAEFANAYLKDLLGDEELVFALRALEWSGGRLAVPQRLVPLMPGEEKAMEHSREVLHEAMALGLSVPMMVSDPRLQIYRTTMDSLLSWFALVDQALERGLFAPADIVEAEYWVRKVSEARFLQGYIKVFKYDEPLSRLRRAFGLGDWVVCDDPGGAAGSPASETGSAGRTGASGSAAAGS
jgi:hypothetical protein